MLSKSSALIQISEPWSDFIIAKLSDTACRFFCFAVHVNMEHCPTTLEPYSRRENNGPEPRVFDFAESLRVLGTDLACESPLQKSACMARRTLRKLSVRQSQETRTEPARFKIYFEWVIAEFLALDWIWIPCLFIWTCSCFQGLEHWCWKTLQDFYLPQMGAFNFAAK